MSFVRNKYMRDIHGFAKQRAQSQKSKSSSESRRIRGNKNGSVAVIAHRKFYSAETRIFRVPQQFYVTICIYVVYPDIRWEMGAKCLFVAHDFMPASAESRPLWRRCKDKSFYYCSLSALVKIHAQVEMSLCIWYTSG